MTDTESPLPKGWARTSIGEIRRDITANVDPALSPNEAFDLFSIPAHDAGTFEHLRGRAIGSTKKVLSPGTVVISKLNPRLSRVAVVGASRGYRQLGSSEWIPLSPVDGIDPLFLAYALRRESVRTHLANNVYGVGGSLMRTNESFVDAVPLMLPPSQEQRRIVEALESYLSRLDDAVLSLERAQAKLKAYRASVLKAAVEGRLVPTEAQLARAEKRDYEPAGALVSRFLADRSRRRELTQLAKLTAPGKKPKRKWKTKYEESSARDVSGLSELPEGWCWTTVGQLGEVTGGLTKNSARDRLSKKIPYLRVANVYADFLVLDEIKEIGVKESELPRVLVEAGDLLVVEGNGSKDQIGRVALWDGSISPMVHQNHLIKARFAIRPTERWVLTWLLSPGGRLAIEKVASSTSGLHTLSISKVENLPIPLPPIREQERILQSIDQASSIVDASSDAIEQDHRRCHRLRQAILKSALEGKLVDQEPNDECAEKLLYRIRAERATTAPRKSRSRRAMAAS